MARQKNESTTIINRVQIYIETMLEYLILLFSIAAGFLLGRSLAVHRRKKKHGGETVLHDPVKNLKH